MHACVTTIKCIPIHNVDMTCIHLQTCYKICLQETCFTHAVDKLDEHVIETLLHQWTRMQIRFSIFYVISL